MKIIQHEGKPHIKGYLNLFPATDKTITDILHQGISGKLKYNPPIGTAGIYQYVYITTDEEPKDGDWCLHPKFGVRQAISDEKIISAVENGEAIAMPQHCSVSAGKLYHKKIVAATDKNLYKSMEAPDSEYIFDVPFTKPSQSLIEALIKANGVGFEEVLIEVEEFITQPYFGDGKQFNSFRVKVNNNNIINIIHNK